MSYYSESRINEVVSRIAPYIELSFMSSLIGIGSQRQELSQNVARALLTDKWQDVANNSDNFSAKLKCATFLHVIGKYEDSKTILEELDSLCGEETTSVCGCKPRGRVLSTNYYEHSHRVEISEREFRLKCMPCVLFLSAEENIVPDCIVYEMKCSCGSPRQAQCYNEHVCHDWAIVDGKILLHLLLFLHHSALGMKANAASALRHMEVLLEKDELLGHRATGLNILGWMFKRLGRNDRARECFQASLIVQPTHNAAHAHFHDMLRRGQYVSE